MMGGGGGPSSKKEAVVMFALLAGALYVTGEWIWKPSYQMKVNQHGTVQVRKSKGFDNGLHIEHKNVECLLNKGYSVIDSNYGHRVTYIHSDWKKVIYVDNPNIKQLLADCKECNVHTEIRYKWDDIAKNERTGSKTLYWHKCYKEEMF